MKFDNLKQEDIKLIKNSMLGHAVTLTTSALEFKNVMPEEFYKRDMNDSDRLIYLVNVLNGVDEYDS